MGFGLNIDTPLPKEGDDLVDWIGREASRLVTAKITGDDNPYVDVTYEGAGEEVIQPILKIANLLW